MIPRGYAMDGNAGLGRARQSIACHSMAWHSVVNRCVTKHSNSKHSIAQRCTTQHPIACRGMAPHDSEGNCPVYESIGPVWNVGSMSSAT
eukprot:8156959-Pyramimonas_sp.AAC.1